MNVPAKWCVFGYDPGWHGAFVLVDQDHKVIQEVGFQSTTGKRKKKVCHATDLEIVERFPASLFDWFDCVNAPDRSMLLPYVGLRVAIVGGLIERVTSGGFAQRRGTHTQFLFGLQWGIVRGIIAGWKRAAPALTYNFVPPAAWQTKMKCMTKGDKNVSKARAQHIYRNDTVKVTHRNADALLIAHCAWRHFAGKDEHLMGLDPATLV